MQQVQYRRRMPWHHGALGSVLSDSCSCVIHLGLIAAADQASYSCNTVYWPAAGQSRVSSAVVATSSCVIRSRNRRTAVGWCFFATNRMEGPPRLLRRRTLPTGRRRVSGLDRSLCGRGVVSSAVMPWAACLFCLVVRGLAYRSWCKRLCSSC